MANNGSRLTSVPTTRAQGLVVGTNSKPQATPVPVLSPTQPDDSEFVKLNLIALSPCAQNAMEIDPSLDVRGTMTRTF